MAHHNIGKRYPYKPRKRSVNFRRCGHPKSKENVNWIRAFVGGGWREYPECRRCRNKQARSRHRRIYVRKIRPPKPSLFPCGHPRIESNIRKQSVKRKNGTIHIAENCKACHARRALQYYRRDKALLKLKRRTKRQLLFQRGSLWVSDTYESDKQCNICGYTLRYTRGDQCVACKRARTAKYNAAVRQQRIALAKRQHTIPSDMHRGGKSELTHMAQMRQDGPP